MLRTVEGRWTKDGQGRVAVPLRRACARDHLKLLMSATSLICVPRARASCRPSRAKSNQKMLCDLKSVSRLGEPPPTGKAQMRPYRGYLPSPE